MKYSRSILIFLFVSSTLSAFYYALNRTNGNVGKSIMFTMYFLAIKIGLIGPTVVRAFDPSQQNEQLVAKVGVLPVFHPYISASNDYFDRSSRLYMGETKMGTLALQYSRSASPIAELRAGSRSEDLKQTAYLLVSIWYALKLQQSYGFQPLPNQVQMPHLEAVNNFLFGKPKSDQLFCQQVSIFDPQEFEKSSPYSLERLSQEDALAQITKQYGTREYPQFDYIDGSLGLSVTYQQLTAKIYHAPSYKLYPELYGINQAQIKAINDYGLVGYVQRGGELPSSDFIDTYHQHLKTFYARNKSTLNFNGSYRGEPAIIVHNLTDGQVLIFRADTKQLWTPSQLRPNQMRRYLETGGIGKQGSVLPTGTIPPPKTT